MQKNYNISVYLSTITKFPGLNQC